MLFAKLLDRLRGKGPTGGRAGQPAPTANKPTKPYRTASPSSDKEGAGFDPYNSGSFDAKPWERINRR